MKRKLVILILGVSLVMSGCGKKDTNIETMPATETAQDSVVNEGGTDAVGTGETYTSEEDNAHAVSASGETTSYDNILVKKTGNGEGDESDFYGTNAAVYAEDGAQLSLTNSKIVTDGSHANAVFSYGEGTTVNIADSVIETSQNNSGGIMVTGGGTLNADNLTVSTQGGSSAAIRSDRGGGTMQVTGGTYKSYGLGSPAIYSTADITVNDAELYSDISQAVVVEGKNSVTLNHVDATGKNTGKNSDNSDTYQAVMIYQSMSGDAAEGDGAFQMKGGSLTSLNGGMFFVTNTVADIELEDVDLTYATDDLLRIEKAGWGNDGSNGGEVNFTATDQQLEGVIRVDDISALNLYLKDGSSLNGAVESDGKAYVELEEGSTWSLTGDSSIAALTCDADAIQLNGYTLTVDGKTYTEGTESAGAPIEFTYASMSGQGGPGGDGNMPPEMPDGNGPDGKAPNGNPPDDKGMDGKAPEGVPEKPDDNGGTPPEKPQE